MSARKSTWKSHIKSYIFENQIEVLTKTNDELTKIFSNGTSISNILIIPVILNIFKEVRQVAFRDLL